MSSTKATSSKVEEIVGHQFKDKSLLLRALTHASLEKPNYERLEFLGDRVLGVVVAEILFKKYPDESEGALAKRFSALVRGQTLAQIGKTIGIDAHILYSDTEAAANGTENENIIADVMESLLGAIYIDGGLKPCQDMINKYWQSYFETMIAPPQDPKTELQEWVQARGIATPQYEIVNREGPDHAPVFTIRVTVEGLMPQEATAKNRRKAEKDAARLMLKTTKNM